MKKCVLVVGHRKGSPGAKNAAEGVTEFSFNDELAKFISASAGDVKVVIVYRDSYMGLPGKINELKPDFIISLHCNAFNTHVSGAETLYHKKDVEGKVLAAILQHKVVEALELPDRGIKAKGVEDRGGYLLKNTNAPCVILEPFFIDRNDDLKEARDKMDVLALAIIAGIHEYAQQ